MCIDGDAALAAAAKPIAMAVAQSLLRMKTSQMKGWFSPLSS
jgi:hypothetical protein